MRSPFGKLRVQKKSGRVLARSVLVTCFWLLLAGFVPVVYAQYTAPLPWQNGIAVPSTSISSIGDFYAMICAVTQWLIVFGILIGALLVIWGGVHYITSAGDERKADNAKSIIRMSLIGIVFLILAVALVRIIANFFSGSPSGFSLTSCGGAAGSGGGPTPTPSISASSSPTPTPPASGSISPLPTSSTNPPASAIPSPLNLPPPPS